MWDVAYINRNILRWEEIQAGFDKLPSSILLSLVATFDSAFADLVKTLLKARPQRYNGSDRTYSVADIIQLGSIDDLISRVIDDEVDQLMNKSHTDQIQFFEKSFDISIQKDYKRWSEFIEIFERRNLAAHGNLQVNDRYIKNCRSAGDACSDLKVGQRLSVNSKYLGECIATLIEFGILLALSAWQKQIASEVKSSFDAVVQISYNLLLNGKAHIASRILDYSLKVARKGADDQQVKMMVVNLAIAYKMEKRDEDSRVALESNDWSAANPLFAFCVASVREDMEQVLKLFEVIKTLDEISAVEIREWPAFRRVRKSEAFREKFERLYGEPLEVSGTSRAITGSQNEQNVVADGEQDETPKVLDVAFGDSAEIRHNIN